MNAEALKQAVRELNKFSELESKMVKWAIQAGMGSSPIKTDDLARFAAFVAASERLSITMLLHGIDRTQTDSPDGWWETSTGAEFGAGILKAINARGVDKPQSTD